MAAIRLDEMQWNDAKTLYCVAPVGGDCVSDSCASQASSTDGQIVSVSLASSVKLAPYTVLGPGVQLVRLASGWLLWKH